MTTTNTITTPTISSIDLHMASLYKKYRTPTRVSIMWGRNLDSLNERVHGFFLQHNVRQNEIYQYKQFDREWIGYDGQCMIFMEQFVPLRHALPNISERSLDSVYRFYAGLWNSESFLLTPDNRTSIRFTTGQFFITSLHDPLTWFPNVHTVEQFYTLFPTTCFEIIRVVGNPRIPNFPLCSVIITNTDHIVMPLPERHESPKSSPPPVINQSSQMMKRPLLPRVVHNKRGEKLYVPPAARVSVVDTEHGSKSKNE